MAIQATSTATFVAAIVRARFGEPTPELTQVLASAHADVLQSVLDHTMSETLNYMRSGSASELDRTP